MKAVVLLNAAAGSLDGEETHARAERVARALATAGVEAEVRAVPGERLADAAREAARSDADVVVAAGGDGTLSAVAGALAGGTKPLGILPLGTLNHFARDLKLPLDLERAARVVASGRVAEVDVAEVNGRIFINNSSIGLYPRAVEERDERRTRLGWGKWRAMAHALVQAFRRLRLYRVRVRAGERMLLLRTPFVFVGNNEYETGLFSKATRQCLDRGELSLYVARATDRGGLLRLLAYALVGRLDEARDVEARCLSELEVQAGTPQLLVALDGEVARLKPPLRYRTLPRALRVVVPQAA